ncbi:aspartate/glutamate racemase family protein [Streptomyces sp. PTY087I2]|uniref:aspartate racemase/maleate isomerase family protein n=1 Tax=Streptomyces sp. PTY087I2 TaxID=1819298 RepID=UPI00080BCEEF|nr:aspartate/glutamate racemase family protein [Streptomyces sp. PTY087I2]OCC11487.1 Maleate isomerase [Streptomyces sp. PTY087I2]
MRPLPDGTLATLAALDAAADRTVRVGLLLPWANVAVETELPLLGLRHTVFHHARLVPASRTTAIDASFWQGLREASAQALDSLSHIRLEAAVLACTSAGFTGGPPLPSGVVSAFDALLQGLTEAAVARVVLVTPYPAPVTEAEAAALAEAGVEVLAHVSLGLVDGYPEVTPDQVLALVEQLPKYAVEAAEAVILSCTGWHTLPVITELEHRYGKPVLSSNLAIALLAARAPAGVGS